ncbi:MAG: radical SAM protein [Candidatus Omnitrophota bacterium]
MKTGVFPTTIDFAFSGRCNLRCKHCNTSSTWNAENELSFDEIVYVFDMLKDCKIFNLNLYGGEPFFYPRIYDLLEILDKYPFRFSILTNGTLIDRDIVLRLKKMRFLEIVQISLDGSIPEVHDWQRGEGSFRKTMKGVELLLAEGVPLKLKAVINRNNYNDIEGMVDLAAGLGLGGMDFGDAVECGRAAVNSEQMCLGGDIHRSMMETVFALSAKYPGFQIGGTLGQKMGMLMDFYANGKGNGKRGNFNICPAGSDILSIRSDGKVVPCSAFWTLVCGDVRKNTLKEIWADSEVLDKIRALAEEPLKKYKTECARCDYVSYCNGGCRASAYYASGGDLKGIDASNCYIFSDIYGFRIPEETVLAERKIK